MELGGGGKVHLFSCLGSNQRCVTFNQGANLRTYGLLCLQAFGAVEAMSDRICIASNGTKNAHLSAEDVMSCCRTCGNGSVSVSVSVSVSEGLDKSICVIVSV